jgi:hypothetical protein
MTNNSANWIPEKGIYVGEMLCYRNRSLALWVRLYYLNPEARSMM